MQNWIKNSVVVASYRTPLERENPHKTTKEVFKSGYANFRNINSPLKGVVRNTRRSSHRGRVRHLACALLSGHRHAAPFVAYFQRTRLELRQCMPPPIVDCPPCSPRLAYRRRVQQAVLSARSLARPCLTCSSPAQCTTSDVRRLAPRLTPRSWSPLAPRAQVRLASTRADLSPSTLIDYVI